MNNEPPTSKSSLPESVEFWAFGRTPATIAHPATVTALAEDGEAGVRVVLMRARPRPSSIAWQLSVDVSKLHDIQTVITGALMRLQHVLGAAA